MFAWDDLRLVLAIERTGNLTAAAAAFGVNHSTMFRRLNALETELGSKLFERHAGGYRATESGRRLLEAAERMESEAIALDRDLTGRDTRLTGQLRVTCSETLAYRTLIAEIGRFRQNYPGITIDLLVDNRVIDLSRREADVALRATRPREGDLFGRKLNDVRWGLYASKDYLKTKAAPKRLADIERHPLIGWSESAPQTLAATWFAQSAPFATFGFRGSSIINQMVAAKDGLGIALLPTYLAGGEPDLVRLFGPLKDLTTELWIITHRSLKDTARVRAFMETVGDAVKRHVAAG